jgi:competence protein ComEC
MLSLTCCSNKSIEFSSNNVTSENIVGSMPLVSQNSENKIIVHYIDVGQGDCIFVELPNQETLLIDAGTSKSYSTISSYIKDLGYVSIDYVVATHPHADHIGSMNKILRNFIVKEFYMPDCFPKTKMFNTMLNTLELHKIPMILGENGTNIIEQYNLSVEILSPLEQEYSNINNYSLVIKIDYGESEFLFTGDAEALVEEELLNNNIDIDSDILKVGHHGSSSSSSEDFIKEVSPNIAIISCGIDNKYGHPHMETIETFIKQEVEFYQTNNFGTIVIEADKQENFEVITKQ